MSLVMTHNQDANRILYDSEEKMEREPWKISAPNVPGANAERFGLLRCSIDNGDKIHPPTFRSPPLRNTP